ncbi:MAG: hypothetical protein GX568_02195 [Candidatus Gastranaerophilales bacterium]|nr:hypothetical protein [Candidatus Gastranaerophilales bacterium]
MDMRRLLRRLDTRLVIQALSAHILPEGIVPEESKLSGVQDTEQQIL